MSSSNSGVELPVQFGELKIQAGEHFWHARQNASGDGFVDDPVPVEGVTEDPANGIAIFAEVLRQYRAQHALQLACDFFRNSAFATVMRL
jgi:hypothetical protein